MNAILLNQRKKKIRVLRDTQKDSVINKDGVTDAYHTGLYNGLELALSILENREPAYLASGEKNATISEDNS